MRVENMPHDQMRFSLELMVDGVGQVGLAPTVAIQRLSDNRYWDGAAFTNTTFVALAMTEVDATDQAGLYEYDPASGFNDYTVALQGYRVRYAEATLPVREHSLVFGIRDEMGGGHVADLYTLGGPATANYGSGLHSAGEALYSLLRATFTGEGTGEAGPRGRGYVCNIAHPGGTLFSTFSDQGVPVPGEDRLVGRLAVLEQALDNQTLVRVTGVPVAASDVDIPIARLDGTPIPGGIAVNDRLYVLTAPDTAMLAMSDASIFPDGSLGDSIARLLSLRQNNLRVEWDTYAASGKPTHGFVYIYKSKADLEADADPWPLAVGSYEVDQTYDIGARPVSYTSTRES